MTGEKTWNLLLGAAGLIVATAAITNPMIVWGALVLSGIAVVWALYEPVASILRTRKEKKKNQHAQKVAETKFRTAAEKIVP